MLHISKELFMFPTYIGTVKPLTKLNLGHRECSKKFEADINVCKKCDRLRDKNSGEFSNLITASNMPRLLTKLGPYQEIDQELIGMLNQDFRLDPKKVSLIPQLFTGSIIHDQLVLIALTVEVYTRYASLDNYLETNPDSVPRTDCYIKAFFCEIITTSDGHSQLRKLVVGLTQSTC